MFVVVVVDIVIGSSRKGGWIEIVSPFTMVNEEEERSSQGEKGGIGGVRALIGSRHSKMSCDVFGPRDLLFIGLFKISAVLFALLSPPSPS